MESVSSQGRIWITWENQRRNHNLSEVFKARLLQFDFEANRFKRYLILPIKTISTYLGLNPKIIFAQNPSIVLAFITIIYGKIKKVKVVVDSHNAGIRPFNGGKWYLNMMAEFVKKHADLTIVTNSNLANVVGKSGGRPFVLPDKIPDFHNICRNRLKLKGRFNVFFVCSFGEDEPFIEVIRSARLLDDSTYIYISGNPKNRIDKIRGEIPGNVILTGYLPEIEYLNMIDSCDLIVDLTTREDCLVCGAYEALGMGKPMILSDTEINRKYFSKGVLYTDNTCPDIAEKIKEAIRNLYEMQFSVIRLREELAARWEKDRAKFEEVISNL